MCPLAKVKLQHMYGEKNSNKASSKKQYKFNSDYFGQTKRNMLCFVNISNTFFRPMIEPMFITLILFLAKKKPLCFWEY